MIKYLKYYVFINFLLIMFKKIKIMIELKELIMINRVKIPEKKCVC